MAAVWNRLADELAECRTRLHGELCAVRDDLSALVSQQLARLTALSTDRPGGSLEQIATVYREQARPLLFAAHDAFQRLRPQQRVLTALDDYDRSIDQLIFALPETISRGEPGWTDLTRHVSRTRLVRLRLRGRDQVVRSAILYGAQRHRRARRRIDGRLLCALGHLSLELLTPWDVLRRMWLWPASQADDDAHTALMHAQQRLAVQSGAADRALNELDGWLAAMPSQLVSRLDTSNARATARLELLTARDDRRREFLGRQARAVDTDLMLETTLTRTETALIEAALDARQSIAREHRDLLDELDALVSKLDAWQPGDPSLFATAGTDIIPGATRARTWLLAADTIVSRLPDSTEVSAHLAARPGPRRSWTTQSPRAIVHDAIEAEAIPRMEQGLEALERQHRNVVLQIERAREVVSFAREAAQSGSGEPQIEREGIENARRLLHFHRLQVPDIPSGVEPALASGLLAAFERAHRLLDEGQFGVLQQAARHGAANLTQVVWQRAATQAHDAVEAIVQLGGRFYRRALVGIGWMPAPPVRGSHVRARGYLTRTLGAESKVEHLPLIYQRLFQLTPVEDPRFLIGRQEELSAIAEARALWEQGREAGVLIVGARGSGKTSLINCALQRVLAGLPVVRSDFVERLTTGDEMYRFLGRLLEVSPDAVDTALTSTPRVIVLEELERTFLRRTNGYGAVRSLLGLISRTARQTLWIISVNQSCFRLLNAALRLEPHFSHQINAMAVEQAHLREAVLLRHNLSGLRLRFDLPSDQGSYVRRLLRATGMQLDVEDEFFGALYRQSGGVFRTAFAFWHRYIDRADGGVLYMKFPTRPAYEPVIGSLDIVDLFTLTALLQHGSLTAAEHSVVFQVEETRSRSWLDNLLARELIEPDPGRYGFRVIPEAAQIIRETLFRRNLG
jgi:hypothetical protein